uniref:Uncharacterized protein n=1 Tax=Chenopodium quinoa TaxID=63459 RepID=A0A803KPA9_CHEQI
METILSPPTFSPFLNPKPSSSKPRSLSLPFTKPIICSLKKPNCLPQKSSSFTVPNHWFSPIQHGLAALALSLALNFSPFCQFLVLMLLNLMF